MLELSSPTPQKPKLIVIYSPKGGAGKTTLAGNLSIIRNTLFVDADPQCDLGHRFGITGEFTLASLFKSFTAIHKENLKYPVLKMGKNFILPETLNTGAMESSYILPGALSTGLMDSTYMMSIYSLKWGLEHRLSDFLRNKASKCLVGEDGSPVLLDQVIVDTNPSMSLVNGFLLMNSDAIIIPLDEKHPVHTLDNFEMFFNSIIKASEHSQHVEDEDGNLREKIVPKILCCPIKSGDGDPGKLREVEKRLVTLADTFKKGNRLVLAEVPNEDLVYYEDKTSTRTIFNVVRYLNSSS